MTDPQVVIVGGGIAGLAAAVDLVDADRRVVLLERRAFPGGRATSFRDREMNEEIDNCQHVVLGCCTNALDLFERIGTRGHIAFHDEFTYIDPLRKRHRFAPWRLLPAPLHFAPAMLSFGALSLVERLAVMRAFMSMMCMNEKSLLAAGKQSMGAWLARKRQPRRVIQRFWEPILLSAVNEDLDEVSALPCLQVFLQGFLPHRDAARMGVPDIGLRELYAEPARTYIEARGGEVKFRANVDRVIIDGESIRGVALADGTSIECEDVISAVPPDRATSILADLPESCRVKTDLGRAPITGIHLWLDRAITELPHAVILDSPMHWLFRKPLSDSAAAAGAKEHIHLVVSASRDLEDMGQAQIIELAMTELRSRFAAAADAELIRGVVVKESRATISPTPANETDRSGVDPGIRGLSLAGDWTDTRWPATLEGSVRSGRIAAGRVLGVPPRLTPDLPRGLLARALLGRVPQTWPSLGRT